jgi:hypothetical protein
MPDESNFAFRKTKVKWPTLRGAYLTDENIEELRKMAFGVIFLEGEYQTRLNFDKGPPEERAVFFEHLHRVQGESLFLLIWVGNYYNGSIFHCAWQFPQMFHWDWLALEKAAIKSYIKIGKILDCKDNEFLEFSERWPTK